MKPIIDIERAGYRLNLAIDYAAPARVPLDADILLSELTAHKPEAVLYLAERGIQPSRRITSEQYKIAITKGIQAGERVHELLIQAIKCISDMTGDTVFYTANYENVKTIYGAGLLDTAALEIELAEVRQRLTMLTRPELDSEPPDNRRRIDGAIKAHREREAQLLEMIKGNTNADTKRN